mgnify:CR=1 FL=1
MSSKNKKTFSIKNIKKEFRIIIVGVLIIILFAVSVFWRRSYLLSESNLTPVQLTQEQNQILSDRISSNNYERSEIIHSLPYEYPYPSLEINAEAAVLVNCDTGDILYKKNADKEIPPASMTKLFLMYTVFEKISEGKASLDDVVPLPPESWASHMPPHSSLMFLGKGQHVTLKELLTGLAVCSGNDASHAIAFYLFGNIENFLSEVNRQIKLCGLEKTVIVEPSGYSEQNITTAEEMAKFARIYLTKYPESLEMFHSVKNFSYPTQNNIAPEDYGKKSQVFRGQFPDSIWTTIVQENTNGLLKTLYGCDGLKTGYIEESGYNLSLTCKRRGERYLSITMGGPGSNFIEGDSLRQKDGETLQEYAFSHFREIRSITEDELSVVVPLLGAKNGSVKLTVPYDVRTCVPVKIFADEDINLNFMIPPALFGKIQAGKEYGKLRISINGMIIEEVPLVADRDIENAFFLQQFIDRVVYQTIK